MAPALVGPPEPLPQNPTSALTSTDPLLAALLANFNLAQTGDGPTHNNSDPLLETGNPCLDLFFEVVPSTRSHTLIALLEAAWEHDPETTLKLICNLRGVRGTGKSDKNGFYTAAIWLHGCHPKTLACNLPSLVNFGYFKDFPEILFRILGLTHPRKMNRVWRAGLRRGPFQMKGKGKGKGKGKKKKGKKSEAMKAFKMREAADKQVAEKEAASEARHKRKADEAKNLIKKFTRDPDFRYLHERISDLFADHLKAAVAALKAGEPNKISLAAKWCPSLDSALDRATLLCEAIARKMFPKEEYGGLEEAHYAYRVRDRLRKEVLVPLRKALELPEVYMGSNRWDEVKYNRVASVAMKTYKEHFLKHDEERFNLYLEKVKSGEAKIAAGALLPHEIMAAALKGGEEGDGGEVAELQWKRMVKDLLADGDGNKLGNCIGICDVSSSMEGTPMDVCISLGILLSELSEEPWKGKVITFSENPQLHVIEGDDLYSKGNFIRKMKWGMNTNFLRVLELILIVAIQAQLKPEQMVKKVFVFSDMEFDKAAVNGRWETDYVELRKKFEENGCKDAVPEIVFWNLRDSRSIPVTKKQKGVAMVSGFSKNAMKLFLQGKQGDPESVMKAALEGEEYNNLVVLD